MTQKIIDAICRTLSNAFGDEYEIYTENVEQGLKEPCFFVLPIEASDTKRGLRSYRNSYPFAVHYFPRGEIDYDLADRLIAELEIINVEGLGKLRSNDRSMQVQDGVVQVFHTYNVITQGAEDGDAMSELDTKVDWRNNEN